MEEHEQVTETDASTDGGSGRRALLTKVGVATAVAAVAGLAASRPAAAANGDTMFVGTTHSATATTLLNGGTTLRVTNGTSAGGASVYGTTNATQGIGVRGDSSGTEGNGVRGEASATDGVGVYGRHSSSTVDGTGVVGESVRGTAVKGVGNTIDFHAAGSGRILMAGTGVTNPPTTGAIGTIARDSAGNLWFAVAANSWRKLAGPGGAGTYHAITPVRVYDSRAAAPTPGVLAPNASRVVSVKDGRNAAGVVTTADAVPTGATAVSFNITVTGLTGPNYLSVAPGDAASTGVSTINFTDNDLANGGLVKLDTSRQIKVFCGDQTGSTHFIVDITGYYL